MPKASTRPDASPDSPLSLSRAVRFALASIVLGLSYPNLYLTSRISSFHEIYSKLIVNRALPPATTFVVDHQFEFLVSGILIPVLAIISIFIRSIIRPIYFSGILVIVTFVLLFFQGFALIEPVHTIIQGMDVPTR